MLSSLCAFQLELFKFFWGPVKVGGGLVMTSTTKHMLPLANLN